MDQIRLLQDFLSPRPDPLTARSSTTRTRSSYCKTFSHLDQIQLLQDLLPPGLAPVTARPSPTWTRSSYCKTFSHLDQIQLLQDLLWFAEQNIRVVSIKCLSNSCRLIKCQVSMTVFPQNENRNREKRVERFCEMFSMRPAGKIDNILPGESATARTARNVM